MLDKCFERKYTVKHSNICLLVSVATQPFVYSTNQPIKLPVRFKSTLVKVKQVPLSLNRLDSFLTIINLLYISVGNVQNSNGLVIQMQVK